MQLVHEAALCVCNLRQTRGLTQKGFEAVNGLPFLASDMAVHGLLTAHTVEEAEALQLALGLIRRSRRHFAANVLAIDPHRLESYTKRQTRRHRLNTKGKPVKVLNTFFCIDADTAQPVCFTIGTAARTVAQATPGLMDLAAVILQPPPRSCLVAADTEHFVLDLFDHATNRTPFDLVVPLPEYECFRKKYARIPADQFTPRWAGITTARVPYEPADPRIDPLYLMVQRSGERDDDYAFKGFISTTERPEAEVLTCQYPKRWHIEEFFNTSQDLGWGRAGTQNLNVRYGHMTMALLAQAAIHELRNRLGTPFRDWSADHMPKNLFGGLDGDIRVSEETIIVTYYNAPRSLRLGEHLEHLPQKLCQEDIDPHIPWLYNFKLDFRFR